MNHAEKFDLWSDLTRLLPMAWPIKYAAAHVFMGTSTSCTSDLDTSQPSKSYVIMKTKTPSFSPKRKGFSFILLHFFLDNGGISHERLNDDPLF